MALHLVPRSLQYLEQVALHGSIQGASRELGISASAIHRQIMLLEEDLGETLFDRDAKGMSLTHSGQLILDMSKNWRIDTAKLETLIQSNRGIEHGHVRVAAMDSMVNGFAFELVNQVTQKYPKVTMDIKITNPKDAIKGIVNGDFEVAVISNPSPGGKLEFHWSHKFPLGCIAAPGHRIAHKSKVSFEEIITYSVVFQSKSLAIRNLLEAHHGWIFENAAHCVVVNSIQLMKHLVKSGKYLAITSQLDAGPELNTGKLTFIPISDENSFDQTIALVSNAQIPQSIVCKKVTDVAIAILQQT